MRPVTDEDLERACAVFASDFLRAVAIQPGNDAEGG
jgi:hypothetical protein